MTDIRDAKVVYVSTSKNADYVTATKEEDSRAFINISEIEALWWMDHVELEKWLAENGHVK